MIGGGGGDALARELKLRKRLKNIYNKREEDFPSLRDYNDYLEHVEELVFNLVEKIDVAETEAEIKEYERDNREQIEARKAHEQTAAARAPQGNSHSQGVGSDDPDAFMFPVGDSGMGMGMAPRPALLMQPTVVRVQADHIESMGQEEQAARMARGKAAGGWSEEMARRRALQEAFEGLCF